MTAAALKNRFRLKTQIVFHTDYGILCLYMSVLVVTLNRNYSAHTIFECVGLWSVYQYWYGVV